MFGELEGTGFDILHPSFATCLTGHGRVERLWTGGGGWKDPFGLVLGVMFCVLTFQTTGCCAGMKQMEACLSSANRHSLPMATRVILRGG